MTAHGFLRRRYPLGVLSIALLMLLAAAACTRPPPPPGPTISPAPVSSTPVVPLLHPGTYEPNDVVLRIELVNGYAPPGYGFTRLPIVSVYGDGRIIAEGRTTAYPAP